MIFAIPVLADLALDVLLVMLALAAGWIIIQVDRHIPNPGLFGFHPLQFLHTGLDDLGNAVIDFGRQQWDSSKALIADIAHISDLLGGAIITAVEHAFANIDHLAADLVPVW